MRFSAMSRNGGDVLVLPALSGQQHDAGSLLTRERQRESASDASLVHAPLIFIKWKTCPDA
jgi:hypothetical protein